MSRLAVHEVTLKGVQGQHVSNARSWRASLPITLLLIIISAILVAGWFNRENALLAPGEGLGYALGIAGASMIALVLLYPLRKRLKFMRSWARLAPWFRWHMVFGCLGPTLIVVHAQFDAKSANGFMALASMLVVAERHAGRYLMRGYTRLYGAKLAASELLGDAVALRPAMTQGGFAPSGEWEPRLKGLEKQALALPRSLFGAIGHAVTLSASTRAAERAIARDLRRDTVASHGPVERAARRATNTDMRKRLKRYLKALRRTGSLAVYERLFALWHVLHLPLIFLLVLTAIIHVVAVHLY
jgi:hypothetical protein